MEFADALKDLLEEKSVSKNQIIEILNLSSERNLNRWLNNDTKPSLKYLIKLAEYFNCSVEYLLGRTEEIGEGKYNKPKVFHIQLKKIMKDKNKTQYRMEQDGICNPAHFNKWFKLKSEPQIETLIKLADYFGVSVDYLLGRE